MADYSQGPIGGAPPIQQPYVQQPYVPNAGPATTTTTTTPDMSGFMRAEKPAYPPWLGFLPPLILLFSLGVLGMVAYVAHTVNDGSSSLGFNIFACVWTLLVGTYLILAFWFMPQIHYRWIILILSVISSIFWLVAFAYLASDTHKVYQVINLVNSYSSYGSGYYGGYSFAKTNGSGKVKRAVEALGLGLEKRQFSSTGLVDAYKLLKTIAAVMAGGAGIGAILFVVFTIFYGIAVFRGTSATPSPETATGTYEPKVEMQPYGGVQQPAYPPAVAQESFAPIKPDGPGFIDPRQQTPGTDFMTPPPPPGSHSGVGGAGYVNPQFGSGQPYLAAHEMPDREYTVSPLSMSEMQGSTPSNFTEMPAPAQR
ncbi:hypothetical protein ABW20_dc0105333 [Dactylellina cionopaga]|nr:hypothetical protein ABW20_dc0105333 [Dactylellina cionopaga]